MIKIEYKGSLGKPGCGWPLMTSGKTILVHIDGDNPKVVDMNPEDILKIRDIPVRDENGIKVGWIEAKLRYHESVSGTDK